jgi:DNA-binding MarR family transcriptional regulator
MKNNIAKSDYSIFDLSNWNPNVALELGLAEGLKKKPQKNYYILLNTKRSKEVPSDIRGIQRLEYTSYDFKREVGLADQLVSYVLSKEFWVKKMWKAIPESGKGAKMRIMALHILAHLREHEKLTPDNLKSIARGSHLRDSDRGTVLDSLKMLGLIKRSRGGGNTYVRGRVLYKSRESQK